MKKYKLGYQIYVFVLVTFLISLPALFVSEFRIIWYIICIPITIFQCMNLINIAFFTYKSVDDRGILLKTFFANNFIEWDGVSGVYDIQGVYAANNYVIKYLFKHIVSIHGKDKKIMITNWTKGSKELIKIVVDECKKRNIKVDLMVEKIIKD